MRRALIAVALLYSLLHFALTGVRQPLANFYGDFLAGFPAWNVASLLGRTDFYAGSLAQFFGQWAIWHYGPVLPMWHYGPVMHLVTLPLFAFPTLRQAYVAWLIACYFFVIVTAAIAARIIDDWLIVILVFCNFNPLYEALTQRNIELFELMLLFGAYVLYRRRRDGACGTAIGVAAMAKFLPLIYLPWLILKRRWRALAAALAVIIPIAIVTQLVLGWQHSGIFLQLREGSFLAADVDQSVSGVVGRIAHWSGANFSVASVSRVLIVVCLIAFSLLILRLRRRSDTEDLEYGLLTVTMVLLPPHNENYYFVFLLLPYLLMYARYRRTRWSWRSALLALSFAIVALPVPLSILKRLTGIDVFSLYLRAAVPFFGAALLVVVLLAEIRRSLLTTGTPHAV